MEIMDGMSMDLEKDARDKLKSVFPECFVEGKLDIDKLLTMCGEYITNDYEKYKFEWSGKSECLLLAQKRSKGTLRPKPDESVNPVETDNIYIKGDNLEVLKLLQTAYYRKVKMIYIDPPYNTGNDFVYDDDYKEPLERYKEITSQATKSNPETMGRFHTAWLNMMYPRLRLAANLLTDDGVCFISIDDNEVHNLRKLCDEIFGEENFVAQFIWHSRQNKDNRNISGASIDHEYIICYSKQFGQRILQGTERKTEQYNNPDNDIRGLWTSANMVGLATVDARPNLHYDLINPKTGINYGCPAKGWRYDRKTMQKLIDEERIIWPASNEGRPRKKSFLNDLSDNLPGFSSVLKEGIYTNTATKEITNLLSGHWFDFPKPSSLLKELIAQVTKNDDVILDFFSGSATTAHAVMQLNAEDGGNRRFIMVQLPELCDEKSEAYKAGFNTICDIGMERIRRAGQKILAEKDYQIEIGDNGLPLLDLGFKVFELDSSNLKAWDGTPIEETEQQVLFERMNEMIDNVKPDRSEFDMVYEIMLKMGVPLTYSVFPITINDKKAYSIGTDCLLLICLAEGVTPEDIIEMCDYAPAKIILSRRCMKDDTTMANAHYILQDRDIPLKLI